MKKLYAFVGILVFWGIIFAVSIIPNERQVSIPDEYPRVILETQPIDPRDLLRGDFVALRYELNNLNNLGEEVIYNEDTPEWMINQGVADIDLPAGTAIFALLSVDTKTSHTTLIKLSTTRPTEGLYLTGEIRDTGWRSREARFGIENYFVPAGKGHELERARNSENLSAVIAIDPETGKGLLVELLISDEPVDFSEIEATPYGW